METLPNRTDRRPLPNLGDLAFCDGPERPEDAFSSAERCQTPAGWRVGHFYAHRRLGVRVRARTEELPQRGPILQRHLGHP